MINLGAVVAQRLAVNLADASQLAQQYNEQNPRDPQGWYEAGLIARMSGDISGALNLHGKALTLDPAFFAAVLDRGICQRELAEYDAAIASFQRAMELDPNHFAPSYFLGVTFLSMRKLDKARQNLDRAIVIAPKSEDALFMAGLCARYQRRFDDSEELFRRVLEASPQHGMARLMVGQSGTLKEIATITDRILSRGRLEVASGPFTGLQYIKPVEADDLYFNIIQKIAGLHESELWLALNYLLEVKFSTIINIGCAEGLYAVGFAVRFPHAIVHAYDIEPIERQRCREMAALNGVEARVNVNGRCSPMELNDRITNDSLIVCDIEGGERDLIDIDQVPRLRLATMLIELHEMYVPGITDLMIRRFEETHNISIINSVDKPTSRFNAVAPDITPRMLDVIEGRGGAMQWAFMVPLGKAPFGD